GIADLVAHGSPERAAGTRATVGSGKACGQNLAVRLLVHRASSVRGHCRGPPLAVPSSSTFKVMSTEQGVIAFVEIPRGSRNKYEYDAELGRIVLDPHLLTPTSDPPDHRFT